MKKLNKILVLIGSIALLLSSISAVIIIWITNVTIKTLDITNE